MKYLAMISFSLLIPVGAVAQTATWQNLSHPDVRLEVGNTVKIEIFGGAASATVTVDETMNGVPLGVFVMGTADIDGYWSITATESAGDVGTYTQLWAVDGVPAATFTFQVYANYTGATCPGQSPSGPQRWTWSPVEYGSVSVLGTVDAAANSWNSISTKIQFIKVPYVSDVVVEDNNSLPSTIGAVTTSYGQDYGTCYQLRDTCGRCMNSLVMYAATIDMNANIIISLASSLHFDLASYSRALVAHEFGHVLRLDHPPIVNQICSEVNSIMYANGTTGFRCGVSLPTACDGTGVDIVYPSAVVGYCPCAGGACSL